LVNFELFLAASGFQGVLKFIAILFIFIIVLLITHYTTKWIGGIQKKQSMGKNISSVEIFKLTNNKYVQILKIGKEYVAVAVAKDNVTYLGKVNEEDLDLSKETVGEGQSFGSVLDFIKKKKNEDKTQ